MKHNASRLRILAGATMIGSMTILAGCGGPPPPQTATTSTEETTTSPVPVPMPVMPGTVTTQTTHSQTVP